uniref:G_PROTEIN_RECEP_F1_2 domain-containing protein n=1 Tax=Macrostomum lignano TaxID=282301 RepID=A0A1I8HT90_9PLAT
QPVELPHCESGQQRPSGWPAGPSHRHRLPAAGLFSIPDTACDFWTSCDVLLCTSSILNLCAISIDRYLVITKPFEYAVKRTPSRMAAMISCVWLLSACISIPPMLGAKEPFVPGNCGYSETFGYQIYATIGAFYIPLSVMLVLYGNIFKLARRMAKADEQQKLGGGLAEEPQAAATGEVLEAEAGAAASVGSALKSLRRRNNNGRGRPAGRSNSDTKAIKTLGAIMGCFTFCWLPFFIMQISLAIWKKVTGSKFDIEKNVFDTFLWLGYVNSFMNPIIYAKFNRDFRTPFKHLLLCHCRSINERLRSQQYSEQYGLPSSGRGTSKRRLGAGPTGANAGAAAANSAAPGASGRAGRSVRRASDASLRRSRHQKAAENNNEQMLHRTGATKSTLLAGKLLVAPTCFPISSVPPNTQLTHCQSPSVLPDRLLLFIGHKFGRWGSNVAITLLQLSRMHFFSPIGLEFSKESRSQQWRGGSSCQRDFPELTGAETEEPAQNRLRCRWPNWRGRTPPPLHLSCPARVPGLTRLTWNLPACRTRQLMRTRSRADGPMPGRVRGNCEIRLAGASFPTAIEVSAKFNDISIFHDVSMWPRGQRGFL